MKADPEEARQAFRRVSGQTQEPYPHQIRAYEALRESQAVVIRAPTGSGKSEAVFVPFAEQRGRSLPMRMIYALPMRALANSLCARFSQYAPTLRVRPQHGDRPESALFYADVVVATLDQVITSYACAPLSLGIRQGNIPAGAVAGSFLVFDEVHTFEPLLGLQSMLLLADRHRAIRMPFVLMSATLPSPFLESLRKRWGVSVIDVEEEDIPVRVKRHAMLVDRTREQLTASIVEEYFNRHQGPMLVVCNTPDRARGLYDQLADKVENVHLVHSRFFDEDRRAKEKVISDLFGKGRPPAHALLIATQVIEVGMDISCGRLLTEAAPIDALVQRAGRCARWGGLGEVVVFGVPSHQPYSKTMVERTVEEIQKCDAKRMTWELEKTLVDSILGEDFEKLAEPTAGARAMALLAKAAFEGRADIAESAVRDALTVEISIHDDPPSLGQQALRLPRCHLHPATLRGFVHKVSPLVWRLEVDHTFKDDYAANIQVIRVREPGHVVAGGFYVVHSDCAAYSPCRGLVLGEPGKSLSPSHDSVPRSPGYGDTLKLESWEEHVWGILKAFDYFIYPREAYGFERLAALLGMDIDALTRLVKLTLIFHDLGKLNEEWQRRIGATGTFLAHRGGPKKIGLPPHATVSAYVAWAYLRTQWNAIPGEPAALAIAQHHSVRAGHLPGFKLADGWFDVVSHVVREALGTELRWEDFRQFASHQPATVLPRKFPSFEKPKQYTSYVVIARSLRLADRIATGGCEDAVLGYEERLGSL